MHIWINLLDNAIKFSPSKGTGGSPIALTAREFDVLALLMAHAETVLTRERIAHEALGYEYVGDTNNVDVHIAHLRAKIEDAGSARIIQTVRGVGYVCRA